MKADLKIFTFSASAIFALFHLSIPLSARASLGGNSASIEEDSKMLQSRLELVEKSNYTIHKLTYDETAIKEFSLPSGTVFAVSWRGPSEPDLSQILGHYYDDYKSASKRNHAQHNRSPRILKSKTIVVEKFGHMRDIRGRAYILNLLPKDFTPEDIH